MLLVLKEGLVVLLALLLTRQEALGQPCSPRERKECVKTISEPYYERICSRKVECSEIFVPCGPPHDPMICDYDEICIQYSSLDSKRSTPKSLSEQWSSSSDNSLKYRCEWKPYWVVDLDMFSVNCTEYYTLKENETCGDAMTKFILPWRVFIGFNPKLKCKEAKEGDKVCVHAIVYPIKPLCGNRHCEIGEQCLPSYCEWRPRYGDKCGIRRCPLGYACKNPDGKICKTESETTVGELTFMITTRGDSDTKLNQRSLRQVSLSDRQLT